MEIIIEIGYRIMEAHGMMEIVWLSVCSNFIRVYGTV